MTDFKEDYISNPFSTGGGGISFEFQVQAYFVFLMLSGGSSPCLPYRPIKKIKLQGGYLGFRTDDVIISTSDSHDSEGPKLLGQIKHTISITKSNQIKYSKMLSSLPGKILMIRIYSKKIKMQ